MKLTVPIILRSPIIVIPLAYKDSVYTNNAIFFSNFGSDLFPRH